MHAVVVAHGAIAGSADWARAIIDRAGLVVAADGGATALWGIGRLPGVVVGDLDSLEPPVQERLQNRDCVFVQYPQEKDQTDTELAVRLALDRGATSIDVLGALGGDRFDHALANVLLLAMPELARVPVTLLDERHEVRLLRGPSALTIEGTPGDLVTLLPLTAQVEGIDTSGLRYPLRRGTLLLGRSRGVSNELTGARASLRVETGRLLVVQHRRTLPSGQAPGEVSPPRLR